MTALLLVALSAMCLQQPTTETLNVDGDNVRIVRDGYGVPHVFASTWKGLFHGDGYAIAQDRLWQMERSRRMALGQLAEIYGPSAVEQDKTARIDGYTEEERMRQFARLAEPVRVAIQSYVDGINECIRKGKLPGEFAQFGVQPRPWTINDSLSIVQFMSRRFGVFGEGELRNMAAYLMLQGKLKDKALNAINDIAWMEDPDSPTSVPHRSTQGLVKPVPKAVTEKHLALLPKMSVLDLMDAIRLASAEPQTVFAEQHGLYTHFGSYAVAVDAKHSLSGHSMLLGAPQMGWTTPQIAHEVQLSGGGINVTGMGFAGVPGVLIGFTPDIAWTTTSGLGDLADVFVLKLDPTNPKNYLYKGKSTPFEERRETIAVKGADPVQITVRRCVYGPVLKVVGGRMAFARCASYWDKEQENFDGFFGFYSAKTMDDFERACAKVVGSHNFLCATKDGQIGYWYTGRYPIRNPDLDPRFPVPGDGEHDWKGFVPFSQLPKVRNPEQGWLGNWNNKPALGYSNSDTPVWGALQRFQMVQNYFRDKKTISMDDLRGLTPTIATTNADAEFILPVLLAAKPTPATETAFRILKAWNHREMEGCPAATIFGTFMNKLRDEMFLPLLGNFGSDSSFRQVTQPSYIYRALVGGPNSIGKGLDYFGGRTRDQVVIAALEKTVTELTGKYGPDLYAVPYRAGRMSLAPLPDVPYNNRGTFIQIVEMSAAGPRGISVLCPGQSEDPLSKHYSDQRDLSSWWIYKPMLWREEDLIQK